MYSASTPRTQPRDHSSTTVYSILQTARSGWLCQGQRRHARGGVYHAIIYSPRRLLTSLTALSLTELTARRVRLYAHRAVAALVPVMQLAQVAVPVPRAVARLNETKTQCTHVRHSAAQSRSVRRPYLGGAHMWRICGRDGMPWTRYSCDALCLNWPGRRWAEAHGSLGSASTSPLGAEAARRCNPRVKREPTELGAA